MELMSKWLLKNFLILLSLSLGSISSSAQSFLDNFFSFRPSLSTGLEVESNVEFSWAESTKNYTLTITPQGDKDVPLDIEIKDGLVRVNGKVLKEEVVRRNGSRVQSSYLSQFSLSESIPEGADAEKSKVEQAGKSIKIIFPKTKESSRSYPRRENHHKKNKDLRDVQVFGEKI